MKAITIWQPWASLLACGGKRFETRSWATSYRGPIAIHAAAPSIYRILKKCFPMGNWSYHPDYQAQLAFLDALSKAFDVSDDGIMDYLERLPTKAVIATAELVNVWHIVHHPGLDVDEAKHIDIGAESLTKNKHDPHFGDYFVPTEMEIALGDWTPGRYAWEIADVKMITPVPVSGRQGLWEWKEVPG